LGTSRAYVTLLLNGKPNLTLSTLYRICYTIGLKPIIRFETEPLDVNVLEKGSVGSIRILTQANFEIIEKTEYEEA
jgi:transcriptional regulator with XRE-family HTH domain